MTVHNGFCVLARLWRSNFKRVCRVRNKFDWSGGSTDIHKHRNHIYVITIPTHMYMYTVILYTFSTNLGRFNITVLHF
jgi:hypothetical protein